MIINSNFHDYYDVAMKHIVDKDIVYHRVNKGNEKCYSKKEPPMYGEYIQFPREIEFKILDRHNMYYSNFFHFLIGFCGNIYPLVLVRKTIPGPDVYAYDIDTLEKAINIKENSPKFIEEFYKIPRFAYNLKYTDYQFYRDFYFNPKTFNFLKNYFQIYNTPIFVLESFHRDDQHYQIIHNQIKCKLSLHRRLDDFMFYTVKDTFSAYQEISMYISGVLGNNTILQENIPDEIMRDMKGFNDWSFKRESPGPRKERRKKKK
ncbi:MAG: hypothetical protein KatS3mg002_0415 [Candidatus Woesearchaeota archaeon]|nr:MAG: hypothetical protein KatS3mg002_0415 [Candidatus Woesearchaeota archaeon]